MKTEIKKRLIIRQIYIPAAMEVMDTDVRDIICASEDLCIEPYEDGGVI